MIRLIPKRRFHVSNRLAVIAAVILAGTSFTGLPGKESTDPGFAIESEANVTLQAETNANTSNAATKKRKLNISVLLFGHG